MYVFYTVGRSVGRSIPLSSTHRHAHLPNPPPHPPPPPPRPTTPRVAHTHTPKPHFVAVCFQGGGGWCSEHVRLDRAVIKPSAGECSSTARRSSWPRGPRSYSRSRHDASARPEGVIKSHSCKCAGNETCKCTSEFDGRVNIPRREHLDPSAPCLESAGYRIRTGRRTYGVGP